MNNPLDKLFKTKLTDHSIEPGTNAWARVSAGLTKKNSRIIWYRAAAALFIGGLAFALWYNSNETVSTETLADSDETRERVQTEKDTLVLPETVQDNKNVVALTKEDQPKEKSNNRKTVQPVEKLSEPDPVVDFDAKSINSIAVNETATEEENEIPVESLEPSRKDAPIVIVYELKPIQRKSEIAEKPEDILLESFPAKKTGFKKVLEVANDVRTGESPLGGLRQAKDEIFAFNFKKEDKNNK